MADDKVKMANKRQYNGYIPGTRVKMLIWQTPKIAATNLIAQSSKSGHEAIRIQLNIFLAINMRLTLTCIQGQISQKVLARPQAQT